MIFKPSSLYKLFFTYICPTFYGGPPATPSNTTSTQTINQSPWQNPVYQALMLGTADKPGPITSMLRSSAEQTAAWDAMKAGGYSPVPIQNQYTEPYTPPVSAPTAPTAPKAAQGGLMSLEGYAAGGKPAAKKASAKKESAEQKSARIQKLIDSGKSLSAADTSFMQNYTDSKANKWSGNIDPNTGQMALRPRGATESSADYKKYVDEQAKSGYVAGKSAAETKADKNLKNTLGTAGKNVTADTTPVYDAKGNITGYKSTNKDFLALQEKARKLQTPEQFKTATDMYKQSSAGLTKAAGYKPKDISAKKADVATMQGAKDVKANKLTQYQMEGPDDVKAPTAKTNQMKGPKSWTDQGTAAKYMSPYQQNVTDIQKRESNRDYQKELNNLNAQSVQAGAFGGSRQAIQQSEAARNQAMLLNDIQAKGQQEAYASGMGQFTNEQGQQLTAGQANLSAAQQTTLANQAASIQAMMANQGMDYNTALQNLQAQMGIQGTQAATDLQAALANQSSGLQANQQNVNTAGQLGSLGQGIAGIGTAQNATDLANLGAQGKVTEATQNLGQSYLDAQSGNAQSWLNAPTSINAGSSNLLNAQPIQGGTTTTTGTSAGARWARGGLIRKGSKK